MKKLANKLLLFLPLLGIILFINLLADPANIFKRESFEKNLAKILISGQNIEGVQDFNERNFQKQYISLIDKKNDIVAVGSSRSMQITSDIFPNYKFFNNSSSWGTMDDYITIYNYYKEKKFLPKIIILGLDPWVLNKNNKLSSSKSDIERYFQIVSPSYFQSSLEYLLKSQKRKLTATDKTISEFDIRLKDGSISYKRETQKAAIEEINQKADESLKTDAISALQNYTVIDKDLKNNFTSFLKALRKDNVAIIFFLPPYHPKVYDYLAKNYKIITTAENYFIETAENFNIKIIGSYNPNKLKLEDSDFYDGLHPKREAVKKIFSKL